MNHSGSHDPLLVSLSLLIAIAASFTSLDLFSRTRSSAGLPRYVWLAAAAIAMGGGIWAMHFVAMLAFSLPGVDLSYDLSLTLLSFVLPIGVTALAFLLVSGGSRRRARLMTSGAIMGAGIAAMHYTGMAAVRAPGYLHYSPFWVALSILVAVVAATAALWIATWNTRSRQRLGAAVVMGLAIAGMHYSAMQGLMFAPEPCMTAAMTSGLQSTELGAWVTGTTLLVLFLATCAATFDRRLAHLADREAAKLRESEERYRLLLRSITDYAIFMLDERGNVTNWNPGAARIKGYSADEIVGSHFSRFYPQEDIELDVPARALKTALEEGRFEHEGWRVRKDGSRFWANVVIEPVRDDAGRHVGFVKITRDTSDRKQAQEALEQAREALFQAQKMEAVGQLTGGVAHDFNNLLMVILGNLDLLRKRLPDDPRARRLLENTVMGAQRGAALTQRMLAFARKQDLKLAAVDLPRLVGNMGDLLERTIGSNITIETHVPGSLPCALADAHQLELALLNLVVNARDAMPEAGAITIGADVQMAERPAPLPEGRYIRLWVKDTGAGMDAQTLARAQEPFFTTKGVGKGTGLGLSMVRGVAEQSGGAFRLLSEPGHGTTAEIWLPVADPDHREVPSHEAPHVLPEATKRLSVLVVDDDPLVRENTMAMLDDLGHAVTEARSGQEALAVLSRPDAAFDVLIVDQIMPGITGLELISRAKEMRPSTVAVLASGFADLPTNPPASLLRLAKPFDQTALDRALRSAVQQQDAVLARL